MRVLITGTSGFIGQALAENMAAEHEVACLSRQPTAVDGVEKIAGSFTDTDVLTRLSEWDFDALVHLAAVTGSGTEADLMAVNMLGSYTLSRYMVDCGFPSSWDRRPCGAG